MDDHARFCNVCGAPLDNGSQSRSQQSGQFSNSPGSIRGVGGDRSKKITFLGISFIIDIVLGCILTFLAFTTYSNDVGKLWGYTYTAPFTSHEMGVIAAGGIGVVFLIAGFVELFVLLIELSKNRRS